MSKVRLESASKSLYKLLTSNDWPDWLTSIGISGDDDSGKIYVYVSKSVNKKEIVSKYNLYNGWEGFTTIFRVMGQPVPLFVLNPQFDELIALHNPSPRTRSGIKKKNIVSISFFFMFLLLFLLAICFFIYNFTLKKEINISFTTVFLFLSSLWGMFFTNKEQSSQRDARGKN